MSTLIIMSFYGVLSIRTYKDPVSELSQCVVRISEGIPGILKISVIAPKTNSSFITEFLRRVHTPVVLSSAEIHKYSWSEDWVCSNVVIIIHQENMDIDSVLSQVLWNGRTKFLLLCGERCKMDEYFREFWRIRVVNVFALKEEEAGIHLYSYTPFQVGNCSSVTPVLLDSCVNGSFKRGVRNICEERSVTNVYQCPVNVSVVNVKPSVIFPRKDVNSSKDADGIEVRLVKTIGEKMNFTPTFSVPQDGYTWGSVYPLQGVIGELYTRQSDFGIGLLSATTERYQHLELSRFFQGRECLTFVVPVGAGSDDFLWIKNITSDLQPMEWILIFTSFLCFTIAIWAGSNLQPAAAFIYTFATFLGQSVQIPKIRTVKLLTSLWLFFSLIIINIYQAALGREITVPLKRPEIKTLRELLDSDLRLLGQPFIRHNVRQYKEPLYLELANNFIETHELYEEIIRRMLYNRKIAYTSHDSIFWYFALTLPNSREKLRLLGDCIKVYYPYVYMQRNSPFKKRVDKIISRVFEAGINQRWRSEILHAIPVKTIGFKPVSLMRSLGIFTVLAGGHTLACIAFLVEFTMGFINYKSISNK